MLASIVVPLVVLLVSGLVSQRSTSGPPTSVAPATRPGSPLHATDDPPARQRLGAPAVSIRGGVGMPATGGRAAAPTAPDRTLRAAIAGDARWIPQAQLPDGAIATHLDRAAVWPYLANFAAIGLAEAAPADRRPALSGGRLALVCLVPDGNYHGCSVSGPIAPHWRGGATGRCRIGHRPAI
jgi:hypothetical protein